MTISARVNRLYILKFHYINFWWNTLCLKKPPYNQIILKIILRQSRLVAKNSRLYLCGSSLDNQIFEEYIFVNYIYNYCCLLFLLPIFFSEVGNFPRIENFPKSWDISQELRIFSRAENFPLELRISPKSWEIFFLKQNKLSLVVSQVGP